MDYTKVQHNQNITLLLTGKSSILSSKFFPPLILNPNYSYSLGLNYFAVYNSAFNVTEKNNKFRFIPSKNLDIATGVYLGFKAIGQEQMTSSIKNTNTIKEAIEFEIPPGGYEITKLTTYITQKLKQFNPSYVIRFKVNESTQKLEITIPNENFYVDCTGGTSILSHCLGFSDTDIFNTSRIGSRLINLVGFNTINIHANIISGSFLNGARTHILHSFAPDVHFGYKIIEKPHTIIYHPINDYEITNLELSIKDEHNNFVNFNNEDVCISLILKHDGD